MLIYIHAFSVAFLEALLSFRFEKSQILTETVNPPPHQNSLIIDLSSFENIYKIYRYMYVCIYSQVQTVFSSEFSTDSKTEPRNR